MFRRKHHYDCSFVLLIGYILERACVVIDRCNNFVTRELIRLDQYRQVLPISEACVGNVGAVRHYSAMISNLY